MITTSAFHMKLLEYAPDKVGIERSVVVPYFKHSNYYSHAARK
jgi:hypothetical protein